MPLVTTTWLEMRTSAELRPKRCADDRFWIGEATVKQWQLNRFLYVAVGGPWAWIDKLVWSEEQWREYAESEQVRTFVGSYDASPAGYYELRRDDQGGVEIAYFGLLPTFLGRGLGGALLTHALEAAWQMNPQRVWVHTCTLDHPAALANYQARGMTIYRVESHQASSAPE
jgi:GNAT superfamily N-acetyltransferase